MGSAGEERDLAAGDFSAWLAEMQAALRGERASDVPCGTCTACCTSAQFIHIGPEEADALAHIPAELLFPAPRLPLGHLLLGYDERGHCPMLVEGHCSIYEHRPRTCRTYDCRVLPAAGLEPDAEEQASIARQVRRWRFSHPEPVDRCEHDAVRAAAAFLDEHGEELPADAVPSNATQRAVLAVEIHDVFLGRDAATGQLVVIDPEPDAVRVAVRRRTHGDESRR